MGTSRRESSGGTLASGSFAACDGVRLPGLRPATVEVLPADRPEVPLPQAQRQAWTRKSARRDLEGEGDQERCRSEVGRGWPCSRRSLHGHWHDIRRCSLPIPRQTSTRRSRPWAMVARGEHLFPSMLATIKAKNADSKHIQPEEVAARSQAYVVPAAPAVANRKQFPGQPEPAPNQPLLGSIDLSPEATSGEQFQTEISTTVSIDGEMFVVSSGGGSTLQVTNATDPGAITLKERVTLPGYASQSVASHGTLLAVALSPSDYANSGGRGVVRFYRVGSDGGLTFQRDVQVGYLPDSIAFNAQGTKLVIANEGEPIAATPDRRRTRPEASASLTSRVGPATRGSPTPILISPGSRFLPAFASPVLQGPPRPLDRARVRVDPGPPCLCDPSGEQWCGQGEPENQNDREDLRPGNG